MYGVPTDLDLSHYVNASCIQIALGEFQLQLHFHPDATIAIEGRWELRDRQGGIVDRSVPNNARDACRLHLLLGRSVVGSSVAAPSSFTLTFDTGHAIEVFDDSDQYESCQLFPTGIII